MSQDYLFTGTGKLNQCGNFKIVYIIVLCFVCLGVYFNANNIVLHPLDAFIKNNSPVIITADINETDPTLSPPLHYSWDLHGSPIQEKCLQNPKYRTRSNINKDLADDNVEFLNSEQGKNYKKILIWNYAYGSKSMGFGFGRARFEVACCKEWRCFMTSNRTDIPVTDFDAILFHFRSLKYDDLPKERSEHQRWIFYEMESPAYSYQKPGKYDGLFNWTMTYRDDSDIYTSYGYVYPKHYIWGANSSSSQTPISENSPGSKQAMAAWFVSHCNTHSYREKYVNLLQKYVRVDVYGKCGNMTCSQKQRDGCYKMIEKEYKFYLSFENSFCKGYVTEKFYNILNYNIVPIVFGLADYEHLSPPHSYINALDFSTIEDLAKYMIYLDKNDTAYNEYFRWKKDYTVYTTSFIIRNHVFCSLCRSLHTRTEKKTYTNLGKWFMDDARCLRLRPHTWVEKLFKINIE